MIRNDDANLNICFLVCPSQGLDPIPSVAMDLMDAKGHHSEICAWTFRPGTNFEKHNSKLVHWSLFEASAQLTPETSKDFETM